MQELEKLLMEFDPLIRNLAKYNPIHGYDDEDMEQEFRMVLVKCFGKFDESKGAQFKTYFITSCKNRVKQIISKMYAEKRPMIDLALNRIDKETGLEFLQFYQSESVNDYDEDLLENIMNDLALMERGDITIDYFFEDLTYDQLAERYDLSMSTIYRINTKNLQELRKKYAK